MSFDFPVYCHKGLLVMSLLISQLTGAGLKSIQPPNQTGLAIPLSAERSTSLESSAYIRHAKLNCLPLFIQEIPCDFVFAFPKAGKSIAANMAIMAITTSNSINVKPDRAVGRPGRFGIC